MRAAKLVAFFAFLSAAFIYVHGVVFGLDPDWWNWADLYGVHHESLFVLSLGVGIVASAFALRRH